VRINHSRIVSFQRCPRFYYYRFVENLVPKRDAVPLIVGRAIHSALAAHSAGKGVDAETHITQIFEETRKKAPWLQAELDDLVAQELYTKQIYKWYREQYPREGWTTLAPEVEGHIPLGSHQLHFRIDEIISWLGYPWLLETKTTAQLGPTFFRKFRLDSQITLYMYAAEISLNVKPKGAVINAIRKSKKLDRAEFAREPVTRTRFQIEECVAQSIQQVDLIERLSSEAAEHCLHGREVEARAKFQMHFNECVRYNRSCDYIECCSGSPCGLKDLFATREPDYTESAEED
jgi:hypothetical protein